MPASIVIISTAAMAGLGATFGAVLSVASRKLSVPVDPRVEKIQDALPNAGCGACGHAGCAAFAKALVEGRAKASACAPGGAEVTETVAGILGVEAEAEEPKVARVLCAASRADQTLAQYHGFADCNAALTVAGGATSCQYACLGMGTCIRACPFDAMFIDADTGLPHIIEERCTGCGACVRACPRDVLAVLPRSQMLLVSCHNPERGPAVKQVCRLGCIGCSLCVKNCPVEVDGVKAIRMEGTLPVIDPQLCELCGTCVDKCPANSLTLLAPRKPLAEAEIPETTAAV